MFEATDTELSPWFVAHSDDKKRARLNIITHLLAQIPYQALPREKIKLPKRQKPGDYKDPGYPFRLVDAHTSRPMAKRPVRNAERSKETPAVA